MNPSVPIWARPATNCLQVATTGVTVNAVCPGYVMTELIERQLENQAKTRGIPKARGVLLQFLVGGLLG